MLLKARYNSRRRLNAPIFILFLQPFVIYITFCLFETLLPPDDLLRHSSQGMLFMYLLKVVWRISMFMKSIHDKRELFGQKIWTTCFQFEQWLNDSVCDKKKVEKLYFNRHERIRMLQNWKFAVGVNVDIFQSSLRKFILTIVYVIDYYSIGTGYANCFCNLIVVVPECLV